MRFVKWPTRETAIAVVCLIVSCFLAIGLAVARARPQINLYFVEGDEVVSRDRAVALGSATSDTATEGQESVRSPLDIVHTQANADHVQTSSDSAGSGLSVHTPTLVEVINEYGVDEWQTIKGIGPALALRIVDYRESNGPFETIDDLIAVSGIGPAKLLQIESDLRMQWGW